MKINYRKLMELGTIKAEDLDVLIQKGGNENMGCTCAERTDEYHGWECSITEGACMFLCPNSKACAEIYGEGPDAVSEEMEGEERNNEG